MLRFDAEDRPSRNPRILTAVDVPYPVGSPGEFGGTLPGRTALTCDIAVEGSRYAQRPSMGWRTDLQEWRGERDDYLVKMAKDPDTLPEFLELNGGRLVHLTRDYWRTPEGERLAGLDEAIREVKRRYWASNGLALSQQQLELAQRPTKHGALRIAVAPQRGPLA